jgi:hypothetical protein
VSTLYIWFWLMLAFIVSNYITLENVAHTTIDNDFIY